MATKNSILVDLQKFFKLAIPKNVSTIEDLKLGKPKSTDPRSNDYNTTIVENFPSSIQNFLKQFYDKIKHNYKKNNNFDLDRLISDIDDMILGEPRINRAIETRASEILQADSNSVALTVNSKDKAQIAFIEEHNDKFKILDKLRNVAEDYAKYGNHVWVLSLANDGIGGISVVKAKELKDRYEFSPADIDKFKSTNQALSNTERMNIYLDSIKDRSEISYFDKFLLGYEVGAFLLPPWNVVHFRHKGDGSLFAPFGEPPYLGSLTPYKNYDVIRGLRAALLSANLPREFVSVKIENTPKTEVMKALVDFAAQWQNTGLRTPAKEGQGIAETVYYPMDMMEIEYKSPDLTMPDEADLEYALDDIVVSTMLPRELLESKDGFGDGSGSIVEKSKYFFRIVYKDQTSILDTLSDYYKLAMILSGDFSLDEIDFTLSLPYPESMVNEDTISNQSDLIDLAQGTIEFFQDTYAGGQTLPPKVMQKIMYHILPFHSDWTEEIVKIIDKNKADLEKASEAEAQAKFENFIRESHELKENYFKQNIKTKKIESGLFNLVQDYYINQGQKNNRKLTESKLKKPLKDSMIADIIYDKKRSIKSFKDEYFKGRHYVHSGKNHNFLLDSMDSFSKRNTDGKQSFKEDYSSLKKVVKKHGRKSKK